MTDELVKVDYSNNKYFLVPTGYIKGDKFTLMPMLGTAFGRPVIMRTREEEDERGWKRNITYYSPDLCFSLPVDLHKKKLTLVGVLSELEEFREILDQFSDREYLLVKIE